MRVGYRVCRKARENLAVLEEKTENKEIINWQNYIE